MPTYEDPLKGQFDADAARWVRVLRPDGTPGSLEIGYAENGLRALRTPDDPSSDVLIHTSEEWTAFLEGAGNGEFEIHVSRR